MAKTTEAGIYFKAIRTKLGMSQKQMSVRLGVNQSAVSLIEVGSKLLDPVIAAKWSKRIRAFSQADMVQIALRDMFRAHKMPLTVNVKEGKLEPVKAVKPMKTTKKVAKVQKKAKAAKATKKAADKAVTKQKRTRKPKQQATVHQLEAVQPETVAA